MTHPQVEQLRFARSEFKRVFEGVSDEDAVERLGQMNCLSWIVGHLANQEQSYWLLFPQGPEAAIDPGLRELVGSGRPASTPPFAEMWDVWWRITVAADPFLDSLTEERLEEFPLIDGQPHRESYGTLLLRNIYHYWFHTGEAHAIRQQLGHIDLPSFVGDISQAAYRPVGIRSER